MIARGAQYNPSTLKSMRDSSPLEPLFEVMQRYTKLSVKYDMPFQNAKFALMQMIPQKSASTYRLLKESLDVDQVMPAMNKIKDMRSLWYLSSLLH